MKKIITLLSIAFFFVQMQAQPPAKMSFQAVIRDANNNLVINSTVGIRISIVEGSMYGATIFAETHTPETNANGLATLEIGNGNTEFGDFATIDWSESLFFIKTETDPDGGSNYSITGISQLLSVPYALHARTVEVDKTEDADADPENEIQDISLLGNELSITGGSTIILPDEVDDADADPSNELQEISLDGNVLVLSNDGGSVTLPTSGEGGDNWGVQTVQHDLTLTGEGTPENPLSINQNEIETKWENLQNIPSGFEDNIDNVEDEDADPSNEIQLISRDGSQLSLSQNGGSVSLEPSGNETVFDNWDKNDGDDVNTYGNQTIDGEKTFTGLINAKGLALPYTFGPDTNYVGTEGAYIGFGHEAHSEDFIGYKNNRFYFKDSPDGGDEADPDVIVGGNIGVGVEDPQEKLEVDGLVYSKSQGFKFPDGTVQTTAATGNGSGTADNWGTQVVQHNNTLSGDGTQANPLGVNENEIEPDWYNLHNIPTGFNDNVDNVDDDDADPTNEFQTISLNGNLLTLSNNGGSVTLPSSGEGSGDNWGVQTVKHNSTLTGNGTSLDPLAINQASLLPSWGNIQGIPGDFADNTDNVNDADSNPQNEIQTLNLSGNTLSLSNGGGSVELETGGSSPWSKNGSDLFYNEGNVGIGKSSPVERLDINGNINLSEGNDRYIVLPDRTKSLFIGGKPGSESPWAQFFVTDDGSNNGVVRMTIKQDKVGIGTLSPGARLDVQVEESNGIGVKGSATSTSSQANYGGYFEANGGPGIGVYGQASNSSYSLPFGLATNYGGYFKSLNGNGVGAYGEGGKYGIWGKGETGVYGFSETSYGVQGKGYTGVYGNGTTGVNGKGTVRGGYFEATNWSLGNYGIRTKGYVGIESQGQVGVVGIGQSSDFYANGPGQDYGSGSSIRWKNNIIEINNPINKLNQIRGVYFDWDEEHGGIHDVGVIAEEVGKVLPEIVMFEENGIDAIGLDYSRLTPLLIEVCKALNRELDEVKSELELLKQQMANN